MNTLNKIKTLILFLILNSYCPWSYADSQKYLFCQLNDETIHRVLQHQRASYENTEKPILFLMGNSEMNVIVRDEMTDTPKNRHLEVTMYYQHGSEWGRGTAAKNYSTTDAPMNLTSITMQTRKWQHTLTIRCELSDESSNP